MSPSLAPLWSAHLAATLAMTGILWVVQLAIYPLFDRIGPGDFPGYHRRYTARIGWVVGPLLLLEAGTAAGLWLAGGRHPMFLISLALLAAAWISTLAVQVPLHRKLAAGYDAGNHRRLVGTNWVRTVAWTGRAGLLLTISP